MNINDRVRLVNPLNPVFKGAEGTVVTNVDRVFIVVKLDDEDITAERAVFMKASVPYFGEYRYIALAPEMEIIESNDDGLLPVGTPVVIVDYNVNVNGLTGVITKHNDSDDLPYHVVVDEGQYLTDAAKTVYDLSHMIFGEFVVMLRSHEAIALDEYENDDILMLGDSVVVHGFDDDENDGFDGLTGVIVEIVHPDERGLIPETFFQVEFHAGQEFDSQVKSAIAFNKLLLNVNNVVTFTESELKKVA